MVVDSWGYRGRKVGNQYRYCVSFILLRQVLTPVMCGELPTQPSFRVTCLVPPYACHIFVFILSRELSIPIGQL